MKRMEWNGRGCVHLDADLFFCLPPTSSKFPSNSPPFPHLHQREMNQLIGPGLDGGSVRGQCHLAASGVIPPPPPHQNKKRRRNNHLKPIASISRNSNNNNCNNSGSNRRRRWRHRVSDVTGFTHPMDNTLISTCMCVWMPVNKWVDEEEEEEREKERKREREKSLCVTSVTSRPGN